MSSADKSSLAEQATEARRSIRNSLQGVKQVTVEMMTKLLADAEAYFGRPQTAENRASMRGDLGELIAQGMCRMRWPIRHSTR